MGWLRQASCAALTVMTCWVTISAAHAGAYLGVDAGWAWASDGDFNLPTAGVVQHSADFNSGYIYAARGGWRFGALRGELEISRRHNNVGSFGSVSDIGPGAGELTANAVMLNGLYDFHVNSQFVPYVGLGIGSVRVSADNIRKNLPAGSCCTGIIDGSDSSFAWQGILGVSWEATPNWAVTLDYRYLASGGSLSYSYGAGCLPDGSFCTRPPGTTYDRYTSQTTSIGIRYSF